MNEYLQQMAGAGSVTLGLKSFVICLAASFVFALAAEFMYLLFYENRATGSQVHRSFLLIGPSITLLFICIQLSLPLSLGLLGALSIVRFRTPIKEPEEIGFLMLLITASIAVATFNFLFAILLFGAVFIALALRRLGHLKWRWTNRRKGVVLINMPSEVYEGRREALDRRLAGFCKRLRLESVSTAENTTSLQYVFDGTASDSWDQLQRELREEVPYTKLNVFFS
ncbi:MAG TPA: DUF4956 domain-containing protein [Kiritimatiellia bacterium]|nr:DUF4956 domain-containing protein [Kiritimatiellia bacterium]HSA18791.1 DUF4956 domain-containing protein [Kiritimatiellia bacterium]